MQLVAVLSSIIHIFKGFSKHEKLRHLLQHKYVLNLTHGSSLMGEFHDLSNDPFYIQTSKNICTKVDFFFILSTDFLKYPHITSADALLLRMKNLKTYFFIWKYSSSDLLNIIDLLNVIDLEVFPLHTLRTTSTGVTTSIAIIKDH